MTQASGSFDDFFLLQRRRCRHQLFLGWSEKGSWLISSCVDVCIKPEHNSIKSEIAFEWNVKSTYQLGMRCRESN